MSSSNNRLCYLIACHGKRSDVAKGSVKRALKRVPKKLVLPLPHEPLRTKQQQQKDARSGRRHQWKTTVKEL